MGVDLGFFKDRLNLEVTYYNKNIEDLILLVNRPSSSGFSSGWENAADLENKGLEVTLDATPVAARNITWNSRVSMWFNRAQISRLDVPAYNLGAFGATLGTYRIDTFASPTQLVGIGPSDQTGEKSDQFFVYGNAEPDFQMAFNNSLSFGNFDFNALVHWKSGGENVNLSSLLSDIYGTSPDFDNRNIDPSGAMDNGSYRLSQLGVSAKSWVEDASYVRLREVGLSYRIPSSLFNNKAKIRVGLSARNMLNFFSYNSYDPEVSNFGTNAISSNVEVTPFPSAKSYFFTLGASF